MRNPAALFTCAAVVAILAAGCAPGTDRLPTEALAVKPVRPVTLPPLSTAIVSVREQIQRSYSALTMAVQSGSPPAILAKAYGQYGQLLMAGRFFDAAEAAFLNAQAQAPEDARWPYFLGVINRRQGDFPHAEAEFTRTLALTPGNLAAHVWLGRIYLDSGRPDLAAAEYERAQALAPTYAGEFGLGRAALDRHNYAGAVNHLERALTLEPKASVAHYPLALAYRGAGQPEQAAAHLRLRGVADVDPPDPLMDQLRSLLENPEDYYHRGQDATRRGAFGEAVELYRSGLALNPEDWRLREILRNSLGHALLQVGDAAGAIAQFEEGIRQVPNRPEHYVSLGVAYLSQGRTREGIKQFEAALMHDPNYAPAIAALRDAQGQLR